MTWANSIYPLAKAKSAISLYSTAFEMNLLKIKTQLVVFLAILSISLTAHANVVLQTNGPTLTGARGVLVNGVSYDVQFKEGSCSELFSGCDSASDFIFPSFRSVIDAFFALEQDPVFIEFFNQTHAPSKVFGCSFDFSCYITTPHFTELPSQIEVGILTISDNIDNIYGSGFTYLSVAVDLYPTQMDSTDNPGQTWAVWSVSPNMSVPEPTELSLLVVSLLGLISIHRRYVVRSQSRSAKK